MLFGFGRLKKPLNVMEQGGDFLIVAGDLPREFFIHGQHLTQADTVENIVPVARCSYSVRHGKLYRCCGQFLIRGWRKR